MSAGTAKSVRSEYSLRRGPATALEAVAASSATRAVATATARRRGSCMYGLRGIGEGSPSRMAGGRGGREGVSARPAVRLPVPSAPAPARLRRRGARPDVAVQPRVERGRGAPGAADVLQRRGAGDAALARQPSPREERRVAQQFDARVVA